MVRRRSLFPIARQPHARGVARVARFATPPLWLLGILILNSSCAIVPRDRMDECQRVARTLRSENARLKDRVLALQSQNRDYADRAVDDSRRLAIQDEAIERLQQSVTAYQDERNRLEAAYEQLTANLDTVRSRPDKPASPSGSATQKRDESVSPSTVP
jgi:hypothetical protein